MKFALIICTYQRSESLSLLMETVLEQTVYPDQIIIVDASFDHSTKVYFADKLFRNLDYFHVDNEHRGLTRQRNYGIKQVDDSIDVVCFLDDDILLSPTYFELLIKTYDSYPDALGVGGCITNEIQWYPFSSKNKGSARFFTYDGWSRKEDLRHVLRQLLGLAPNRPPGFLPEFSHGYSPSYLPPTGKVYPVEQLMGGVSSFRKNIVLEQSFSTFFEGYGLYEDADFTLRISQLGALYVNTAAQLEHHHHPSGRPNQFHYGKMVVRNGWYVWRVRWPKPSIKAKVKWHLITLLLAFIRLANVVTTSKKQAALTEFLGRMTAYINLWFVKPKETKS